jgi:Methyltransferase domain
MSKSLRGIFEHIDIRKDYSDVDFSDFNVDLQGWGSEHPMFNEAIGASRPSLIIEVGSWKGASAHNMLNICKRRGFNTEIICVDTWLGSNDTLWLESSYRESLRLKNGYPNIFWQFVYNMIKTEMIDYVYPLPMTSTAAYHLLKRFQIQADLIYIDAGHEHDEVYMDLSLYYNLLRPGGVMVCDDYTDGWPGVVSAINQFIAEKKLPMTAFQAKTAFMKPMPGNS